MKTQNTIYNLGGLIARSGLIQTAVGQASYKIKAQNDYLENIIYKKINSQRKSVVSGDMLRSMI